MDYFFGLDKVSAHDDSVAYLTTTHDPVELGIIRSILDGEEIPYMIRERGGGALVKVVAGYSVFGSDVFVPKALEEKAKEVWNAYQNGEIVEDAEAESSADEV